MKCIRVIMSIFVLVFFFFISNVTRSNGKKVVIVGEMSDEAFRIAADATTSSSPPESLASSNSQFHLDEEEPIYDSPNDALQLSPVRKLISRPPGSGSQDRPGGLFVPAASYSISRHPYHATAISLNARMRPSITESAVYEKKPDIIQYRGQYLYKAIPSSSSYSHQYGHYLPSSSSLSPFYTSNDLHSSSSKYSSLKDKSGEF